MIHDSQNKNIGCTHFRISRQIKKNSNRLINHHGAGAYVM